MQIPSGTLERALRKGLGVCNTYRPILEYFEELAKVDSGLEPSVEQLRIKLEHLDRLCRAGIDIATRMGSTNGE